MSVRITLGGPAREAAERVVARLVEDRIASRITAQDATVWPDGAAHSLAWTESVAGSVALIDQVRQIRHELRHASITRAVVPVPTGATLAAAMVAETAGGRVDTDLADPDAAAYVLAAVDRDGVDDVVRTLTGEDPRRIVLLAAAGDDPAAPSGTSLVRADAAILDGADGAFSAAALVPAGLAGADLRELLDEAESEALNLAIDHPANNGLLLGAVLASARDGVAVVADGTHIVGFPVWAARLLAEVVDGAAVGADPEPAPGGADALVIRLVEDAEDGDPGDDVRVSGTLGELTLAWLYAATVASVLTAPRGAPPADGR